MNCVLHVLIWDGLYNWQTLIAGGAAVFGGWLAYLAGIRQANAARAGSRAYVLASRTVVTNVVDGTGVPEAQVTIKNVGQTPAHNVISVNGFAFDRYPSTPNLAISDQEVLNASVSREVLGPGDISVSVIRYSGGPFTPETKASLANGSHIIYVYGEIRYRDAFGRKQWTKYRYMMGGPVGLRGEQMAACEEGNEAS